MPTVFTYFKTMKKIFFPAILSLMLACDQKQPPEENYPPDTLSSDSDPLPEPLSDTTIAKFSDEENWLSGLLSDKKETREAAFKKYIVIRDTTRNRISEIMAGYIRTYFSTHPKEFLSLYTSLKSGQQKKVTDDIASEFRASGANYKADLDQYFQDIQNSCTDCAPNLLKAFKNLKQNIQKELVKSNS